jgi:hypothetical protein
MTISTNRQVARLNLSGEDVLVGYQTQEDPKYTAIWIEVFDNNEPIHMSISEAELLRAALKSAIKGSVEKD